MKLFSLLSAHSAAIPGGRAPDCPVPSVAAGCAVDLLFLVDGSWSMGLEGFLRAKAFVKRVIHSLLQTSPSVLIGFMQYSDTVHVEFTLGQHDGYTSLVRSIDAVKYRGGNTNTGGALAHVAQLEFRAETGSRQEVPHAVVVLTNSRSRDAVAPPAQFAREREIFLLAVGSEQVRAELQSIATPLNALPFSDPLDLYNKVMELRSRICSLNSQGAESLMMNNGPRETFASRQFKVKVDIFYVHIVCMCVIWHFV